MDWSDFAEGLVAELPYLSAGAFIVIKEPGEDSNRRHVQFLQKDDQLLPEVVANRFLEGDARASADGDRIICAAGWVQPGQSDLENWEAKLGVAGLCKSVSCACRDDRNSVARWFRY